MAAEPVTCNSPVAESSAGRLVGMTAPGAVVTETTAPTAVELIATSIGSSDPTNPNRVIIDLDNVEFRHADAQIYPFETAEFDVVISRMGSMFFGDPLVAFANLHRALRPEGRLTLLTWQGVTDNEWLTEFRAQSHPGLDAARMIGIHRPDAARVAVSDPPTHPRKDAPAHRRRSWPGMN